MAALILIIDGLGGWSNPEHNFQTELEVANTPNFDYMAKFGECGLYNTIDVGVPPGSSGAILSLLGYDPRTPTRGVLAALGLGIYEDGAWAARTNLATVRDGMLVDRRAGRIADEALLRKIEEVINSVEPPEGMRIRFARTLKYRGVLVMHFSEDPKYILSNDPEAPDYGGSMFPRAGNRKVEEKLRKWLTDVYSALMEIPENAARELPANFLLLRGIGKGVPKVESFSKRYGAKAVILSKMPYMRGIAKFLGIDFMEVDEGNLLELKEKIPEALERYDLVLTHVKGPDPFGHDGDFYGKIRAIEEIDKVLGPVLLSLGEKHVIAVTGDHSTPALARRHTGDPCPLLIYGPGGRRDGVDRFSERACAAGILGHLRGDQLVKVVLDRIGKLPRVGA